MNAGSLSSLRRIQLGALLAAIALAGLGCSQGADVVEVSGKLTRNGKPLPNFAITFHPEKGRTSVAVTESDGSFEMVYTRDQKGVVRGKHKVHVHYAPPGTSYNTDMKGAPDDVKAIQEKYGTEQTTKYEINIDEPKRGLEIKLD